MGVPSAAPAPACGRSILLPAALRGVLVCGGLVVSPCSLFPWAARGPPCLLVLATCTIKKPMDCFQIAAHIGCAISALSTTLPVRARTACSLRIMPHRICAHMNIFGCRGITFCVLVFCSTSCTLHSPPIQLGHFGCHPIFHTHTTPLYCYTHCH